MVFKSSFTFGELAAERDHLLLDAYYDNGDYEAIESRKNPRCFVIGRTGSGKSAAFRRLESDHPEKVVRVDPESLAFPYITNLDVLPQLLALGVHLDPFLKALWKHVFLVEILRHRYNLTSQDQKFNLIASLKKQFQRDPAKIAAIDYMNDFGDSYWCETHERIKHQADTFVRKITAVGNLGALLGTLGLKGSTTLEQAQARESRIDSIAKYQSVVNEVQVPRLNEMISILNSAILNEQHFTYLIIDDLDKEWVDEKFANLLIRCLFQAVLDMQKVRNLKILVALRTNIFDQLNYGEQARGGQEEKFRGLALFLRWTENDLRGLLDQRARVAAAESNLEHSNSLARMLPNTNKQAGNPVDYVLSRTLMRPRDAILYLNECARQAAGKNRISWRDIREAEKEYSKDRLLALRDEWKDPYFDVDSVLAVFRRCRAIVSRAEFTEILDNIAMLLGDERFRGQEWLMALSAPLFLAGSNEKTWYELYGPLTRLLYDISFIGVVKGNKVHYSYDLPQLADAASGLSQSVDFSIHPAFRSALEIVEEWGTQD